jgi:putative tryptophan/tyrosine transport system substrate-binding protein
MRRRDFIWSAVLAIGTRSGWTQQPAKVHRIAIADPVAPTSDTTATGAPRFRVLFEEPAQFGFVEGHSLVVERYSAEGRADTFSDLAREVVRHNPDLICAISARMVLNFKAATATIPIVAMTADPIAAGIVTSLARPGGNITGVSADAGIEIWGKRLEILREIIPSLSNVGFLASGDVWNSVSMAAVREASQRIGISLVGPPLGSPLREPEYRRVLAAMVREGVDALVLADQLERRMGD